MAAPVWNPVPLPDFGQSNQLFQSGQRQATDALSALVGGVKQYQDTNTKRNTENLLNRLYQPTTPEDFVAASNEARSLAQQMNGDYDQTAFRETLDKRPQNLMQQFMANKEYGDTKQGIADQPYMKAAIDSAARGNELGVLAALGNVGSLDSMKSLYGMTQELDQRRRAAEQTRQDQNNKDRDYDRLTIKDNNEDQLARAKLRLDELAAGSKSIDPSTTTTYDPQGNRVVSGTMGNLASGDFVDLIAGAESSNNDKAKPINPQTGKLASTAASRYQIIDSTFVGLAKRMYPDLKGKSDADILRLRENRDVARSVAAQLDTDNVQALISNGIPVTVANRYGAYTLGAAGFAKFYREYEKDPNGSTLNSIAPEALNANGAWRGDKGRGKSFVKGNGITNQQMMDKLTKATTGSFVPYQKPITAKTIDPIIAKFNGDYNDFKANLTVAKNDPNRKAQDEAKLRQWLSGKEVSLGEVAFGDGKLYDSLLAPESVTWDGSQLGDGTNKNFYALAMQVPSFKKLDARQKLRVLVDADLDNSTKQNWGTDYTRDEMKKVIGKYSSRTVATDDKYLASKRDALFGSFRDDVTAAVISSGQDPSIVTNEYLVRMLSGQSGVSKFKALQEKREQSPGRPGSNPLVAIDNPFYQSEPNNDKLIQAIQSASKPVPVKTEPVKAAPNPEVKVVPKPVVPPKKEVPVKSAAQLKAEVLIREEALRRELEDKLRRAQPKRVIESSVLPATGGNFYIK